MKGRLGLLLLLLTAPAGAAPVLHDPSRPDRARAGETVRFEVTYRNAENRAPEALRLVLGDRQVPLRWEGFAYREGVRAAAEVPLPEPGSLRYHYEASSGGARVRLPAEGGWTVRVESVAERERRRAVRGLLLAVGPPLSALVALVAFPVFWRAFGQLPKRAARQALAVALIALIAWSAGVLLLVR